VSIISFLPGPLYLRVGLLTLCCAIDSIRNLIIEANDNKSITEIWNNLRSAFLFLILLSGGLF